MTCRVVEWISLCDFEMLTINNLKTAHMSSDRTVYGIIIFTMIHKNEIQQTELHVQPFELIEPPNSPTVR